MNLQITKEQADKIQEALALSLSVLNSNSQTPTELILIEAKSIIDVILS